MPNDGRREDAPIEGIAGGPGPTPPGFDDGTPSIEVGRPPGEDPPAPRAAEERDGRAGGAARGDPEEPDPS